MQYGNQNNLFLLLLTSSTFDLELNESPKYNRFSFCLIRSNWLPISFPCLINSSAFLFISREVWLFVCFNVRESKIFLGIRKMPPQNNTCFAGNSRHYGEQPSIYDNTITRQSLTPSNWIGYLQCATVLEFISCIIARFSACNGHQNGAGKRQRFWDAKIWFWLTIWHYFTKLTDSCASPVQYLSHRAIFKYIFKNHNL